MEGRDAKGRFNKGCVANPNGNNQFTSIVPLLEALGKVGKKRKEDFWMMVARRCWESDRILAAILRKIIPDKLDLIQKEEDKPYLYEEFKDMSPEELVMKSYELNKSMLWGLIEEGKIEIPEIVLNNAKQRRIGNEVR